MPTPESKSAKKRRIALIIKSLVAISLSVSFAVTVKICTVVNDIDTQIRGEIMPAMTEPDTVAVDYSLTVNLYGEEETSHAFPDPVKEVAKVEPPPVERDTLYQDFHTEHPIYTESVEVELEPVPFDSVTVDNGQVTITQGRARWVWKLHKPFPEKVDE